MLVILAFLLASFAEGCFMSPLLMWAWVFSVKASNHIPHLKWKVRWRVAFPSANDVPNPCAFKVWLCEDGKLVVLKSIHQLFVNWHSIFKGMKARAASFFIRILKSASLRYLFVRPNCLTLKSEHLHKWKKNPSIFTSGNSSRNAL